MRRRAKEHKKKRDARDGLANPHLKSPTSHPLSQPYGMISSQSPTSSFGGPLGVNTYAENNRRTSISLTAAADRFVLRSKHYANSQMGDSAAKAF